VTRLPENIEVVITIDHRPSPFSVKLPDNPHEDLSCVDLSLDERLSKILKDRASTKPNLVLETKIAIYSELLSHTKAPMFQSLMDGCLAQYAKIIGKTSQQ